MINDCICAISTFLSESAISIVRMSGEGCFEILKKVSNLKEIEPNTIKYRLGLQQKVKKAKKQVKI